ncbi:MAG: hypothetical protein VX938_13925, partial [Myxococcota bacterium]|nr:hypothetical protein [Myxococcota bacterium]
MTYVWKLNGEILEEQTESTLSGVFVKGDSVRCEATPKDGYGEGEPQLSGDVVIGNKLPAISDVTITPPYGALCDTFTCAPGDVLDPDVEDPIALSYAWTLNGEPADQTGDVWVGDLLPEDELQCFITAWDGTLELEPPFDQVLTDPVGSNLAEIVNNPPTVQSVAIPEVDPAVGDTLTCSPVGFQDAECAPEPAYIYKWYVGGATLIDGAESETLVTWGMSEGDVISCQAIPFDGFDYGSPELSNEVVLGPEVIQCPDPSDAGACDDGDACTVDDACEAGVCVGAPVVCDDGDLCNGVETCDGATGSCLAGDPPVLDDGVDCTVDTCDPATGVKHVPDHAACNGGATCTSYTCDPVSGCEAAATDCCGDGVVEGGEDCDDGNNEPGDGCAPDCTAEPCASLRFEPTSYVDFGGAAELIQPSDELTFETWVRWSGGWAQLQNYAQVVVGTVSSHTSGGWNIALEEAERWQLNVRT